MTNELAEFGAGSYISEFVGAGPKNYAFKVYCPAIGKSDYVVKIRGFSLNYAAGSRLNLNTLK